MKKSVLALCIVSMLLSCLCLLPVSAEDAGKLTIESYQIVSGDGTTADAPFNGNLTDGQVGSGATADLESGLWCVFEQGKGLELDGDSQFAYVVVDLGKECESTELRMHHLGTHPAGYSTPWALLAAVSNDNMNWTDSPAYANTDDNGDPVWSSAEDAYWTTIVYDSPLTARYVKFKIAALSGAAEIAVSEIEVYGTEIPEPVETEAVTTEAVTTEAVTEAPVTEAVTEPAATDTTPVSDTAEHESSVSSPIVPVIIVIAVIAIVAVVVVAVKKKK